MTPQSRGLLIYCVFVMRVERGMVHSCEAPGMSGKRRRGRTGTICHEIVFKRITHKVSIFWRVHLESREEQYGLTLQTT